MRLAAGMIAAAALSALLSAQAPPPAPPTAESVYLGWSAQQAEAIGKQAYQRGRVGGIFDTRILKTERSYNYKLAATWLTPEVVRATARLAQLRSRYSDDETRRLVHDAEAVADTVVMVEIDPREGSGVIPLDWEAFLQPKDAPARAVRGENAPALREVPALAGVLRRNYDYDRFWVKFPLRTRDGKPLFTDGDAKAELIVRILDKEGRVSWPIPKSIKDKSTAGATPPSPNPAAAETATPRRRCSQNPSTSARYQVRKTTVEWRL